jgi:signal peptidase I
LVPTPRQGIAAAALAGALLAANDVFVCESVVIPSSSMRPTLLPNERVFLRHLSGPVKRFDVVVIESPRFSKRIVKRVIGLPGDRVRLVDSWRVLLNGVSLTYGPGTALEERREAADHDICVAPGAGTTFGTRVGATDVLLGPREYYVLGDNRLASDDSRSFGPVNSAEIQGTLGTVWYSYDLTGRGVRTDRLFRSTR